MKEERVVLPVSRTFSMLSDTASGAKSCQLSSICNGRSVVRTDQLAVVQKYVVGRSTTDNPGLTK